MLPPRLKRQRLEALGVLEAEIEATRQLLVTEHQAVASVDEPLVAAVDHLLLRLLRLGIAGLVLLPFVLRISRRIAFGRAAAPS